MTARRERVISDAEEACFSCASLAFTFAPAGLVGCAAAAGAGRGLFAFCAKKAGAHAATAMMESEAARVKRRTTKWVRV